VCLHEALGRGVRGRCHADPRSALSEYLWCYDTKAGYNCDADAGIYTNCVAESSPCGCRCLSSAQAMVRISKYFLSVARFRRPLGGEELGWGRNCGYEQGGICPRRMEKAARGIDPAFSFV
jgi:hypothetical protein